MGESAIGIFWWKFLWFWCIFGMFSHSTKHGIVSNKVLHGTSGFWFKCISIVKITEKRVANGRDSDYSSINPTFCTAVSLFQSVQLAIQKMRMVMKITFQNIQTEKWHCDYFWLLRAICLFVGFSTKITANWWIYSRKNWYKIARKLLSTWRICYWIQTHWLDYHVSWFCIIHWKECADCKKLCLKFT